MKRQKNVSKLLLGFAHKLIAVGLAEMQYQWIVAYHKVGGDFIMRKEANGRQ